MDAKSALSLISLVEFRNNPFCPGKLVDSLVSAGCSTLEDVLGFTEDMAFSVRGFGKGKMAMLADFQAVLTERTEEVYAFYRTSVMTHVVGSDGRGMQMSDRIARMLGELLEALELSGDRDMALVCRMYLMQNMTVGQMDDSGEFGVCRERIRQKSAELRSRIVADTLGKWRIAVDADFLRDFAEFTLSCADRTMSNLLASLGEGAPQHGYTNLLGFTVLSKDVRTSSALTEDFVLSGSTQVGAFLDEITAVAAALRADVRPQSAADLHAAASRTVRMGMERTEFLLGVLPYCERTQDGLWMMSYANLRDYEKAARIIWEKKDVTLGDMDVLNAVRTGEDGSLSNTLHVTQKAFPWCRPVGRSGRWVYCGNGEEVRTVSDAVAHYVASHGVFSFSQAVSEIRELGYDNTDASLRSYFMSLCRTGIDDSDLLCARERTHLHPEIRWRRTKVADTSERVLEAASAHIALNGPSRARDLVRAVVALDEEGTLAESSVTRALYGTLLSSGALVKGEDGLFRLGDSAASAPSTPSLPSHYGEVIRTVREKVAQSPEGMCSLSSLRKACERIIAPFAQANLFYKIMSEHCPEDLSRVYVDGKAYLRLAA